MTVLSRAELLRRGIGGGAMLAASGAGFAAFARPAAALTVPDGDVAYLRLLVAAELLKADFHTQALASGKLAAAAARAVKQMQADDNAHYAGLVVLMNEAAQPPATADDIDFSYPAKSFGTQASIFALALKLATISLGSYLGALEDVSIPQLRLPIAQIAANEAQHVSAASQLLGKPMIGRPFAPSLSIDAASTALGAYES